MYSVIYKRIFTQLQDVNKLRLNLPYLVLAIQNQYANETTTLVPSTTHLPSFMKISHYVLHIEAKVSSCFGLETYIYTYTQTDRQTGRQQKSKHSCLPTISV